MRAPLAEDCSSRRATYDLRRLDLTKRYGETVALDHLGLSIEAGEVHGYPGPNGAGKTTTIRLLLGIHRPSRSRAATDGGPPLQVPRRPGHPRRGREEPEHVARLRLFPGRIVLRLLALGGAASSCFRLGFYRLQLQLLHSLAHIAWQERLEKPGDAFGMDLAG